MGADEFRTEPAPGCILCGAQGEALYGGLTDRFFSAPGVWGYKACRRCGLLWLDPRPARQSLELMYRGYYTHAPSGSPRPLAEHLIARVCGWRAPSAGPAEMAAAWLVARLGVLRDYIGCCELRLAGMSPGRVLELGCGNGRSLARLRGLGWEVEGVEPDPDAAAQARAEAGGEVIVGSLDQAAFPDERFDAVIVRNAFGYIPDPLSTLAECRRILRPGGRLVMVVPNADSRGHRIFKSAWLMLDPPREHFVYGAGALRACARRAGFPDPMVQSTSRLAFLTWIFSAAIRSRGAARGYELPSLAFLSPRAGLFQLSEDFSHHRSGDGEELFLVAEKSG